jgi:hypothetical protein
MIRLVTLLYCGKAMIRLSTAVGKIKGGAWWQRISQRPRPGQNSSSPSRASRTRGSGAMVSRCRSVSRRYDQSDTSYPDSVDLVEPMLAGEAPDPGLVFG